MRTRRANLPCFLHLVFNFKPFRYCLFVYSLTHTAVLSEWHTAHVLQPDCRVHCKAIRRLRIVDIYRSGTLPQFDKNQSNVSDPHDPEFLRTVLTAHRYDLVSDSKLLPSIE